ncbi:DUF2892 domain-containing protein [Pontibacter sp. JH31]|uniref:DUF2892 domain-containing protein n=1 Tax=Pontibacter aquaedesilientis TaxID=2766980 RepID=A0ABR7XGA2_9BACT|nr:DUF2892 domain-containing protein [Pontibacter aquaedesilientis]MBD1396431.1 DUF2892 domain-containing protein [Pontibacter aquaedesilientis]
MNNKEQEAQGPAGESTPCNLAQRADDAIKQSIGRYKGRSKEEISERLRELDQEWSFERTLEVNASTLALSGTLLGAFVNKRWFILPGLATSFLLQQGIQGWCPPLPLMRALGIRSRREIDDERYALKALRGDFDEVSSKSSPTEVLDMVRSS